MTSKIAFNNKLGPKTHHFFNELIKPLKMTYAYCNNEALNFRILNSNDSSISKEFYSIYNLPSLMRVLINKTNLLSENDIDTFFVKDKDKLCYVLEWSDSKKILIFTLSDLEFFADKQFSKDITNRRDELMAILDEESPSE